MDSVAGPIFPETYAPESGDQAEPASLSVFAFKCKKNPYQTESVPNNWPAKRI
jgi:hypothetical protein